MLSTGVERDDGEIHPDAIEPDRDADKMHPVAIDDFDEDTETERDLGKFGCVLSG